jgi:N-acetylglutamate synthase-like GNAT family acetyltransferase
MFWLEGQVKVSNLGVQIREATKDDLEGMQQVLELVWLDNSEQAYFGLKSNTSAWVALEQDRVIGFSALQSRFWHPQRKYLSVHVLPEFQGQGIGFALYKKLKTSNTPLQTATSQQTAIQFLERQGFREVMQTWNPVFDPRSINLEPFQNASTQTRAIGIEIKTFAELPQLEDEIAMLHHQLYVQSHSFNPPLDATLEQAKKAYLDDVTPEALFVALQHGKAIGVSSLRGEADSHELVWSNTIGGDTTTTLALVHHVLRFALEHQIKSITGEFDSLDPHAMVILETLQILRGNVWITFQR